MACATDYKLCGNSTDDYDYTICVANDKECPLVNVWFNSSILANGT